MASSISCSDDSGMKEACGVFGCVAAGEWPTQLDVPHIICVGLVGLQHRGQESAGIVTSNGIDSHKVAQKKGMGLVSAIFCDEDLLRLRGNLGIGHTRYSTAGVSDAINCQPFVVETLHGLISVAHNGELVNAKSLKKKLLRHGVGLSTDTDSELIIQLLTHTPDCGEPNGPNWVGRMKKMMMETMLAYSLLVMHQDRIYAIRDPYGNRPLCIGKIVTATSPTDELVESNIDGWVVSSESCTFQSVNARYYREVLPGEIVEISRTGIKSHCVIPRPKDRPPAFCIFEYVYFARPDSIFEDQMVYSVRQRCGRQLAIEAPVDVDMVCTVPESATPAAMEYAKQVREVNPESTTPAAMKYAKQLGIAYGEVLCKNRYVGRTFIQPSKKLRQLGVAKKFGVLTENVRDKRLVLIDDSIVRGNTMAPIIKLLKNAGAKEVHIRIASPPVRHPCYMGINIPTKTELIANSMDMENLAPYLGADSLKYLTVEGLVSAVQEGIHYKNRSIGHCTACLSGNYPTELEW